MTTIAPERETEQERVEAWRLLSLLTAGYPKEDAETLAARPDVDTHVAVEMLAQGCSLDLALKILL